MTISQAVLSDDDLPLRPAAGPSGVNGNGYAPHNGVHTPRDVSSLTSDDDDMPLVRPSASCPLRIARIP